MADIVAGGEKLAARGDRIMAVLQETGRFKPGVGRSDLWLLRRGPVT